MIVLAIIALAIGLKSSPVLAADDNSHLVGRYINSILNKKPAPKWDEVIAPQLAKREEQVRQEEERKTREAAEAARIAAEQVVAKQPPVAVSAPSGTCADWMTAAGIADQASAYQIMLAESGCRPLAMNPSGAYGVCQSLPGNKMASAGADWATNPVTQMRWCNSYAIARYGSWANAWAAWQRQRWW